MRNASVAPRRPLVAALWTGVTLLVLLALASSVGRAIGVIESLLVDGPVPTLSRLDRESMAFMERLGGVDPASDIHRDLERQNEEFLGKFNRNPIATLLHVLPGALFIVLAPLQFSRRIRTRYVDWHRWSGRVVLLLGIPVTISGFYFGVLMPFSGFLETSAIVIFGTLFVVAMVRGYASIRRRAIAQHREWMIRMFAVAIGVASVRVAGIILAFITLKGPEAWFGYSVWIGFVVTVAAAEWWIRRTRRLSAMTVEPVSALA
jgi:uncharacterized membrane protein